MPRRKKDQPAIPKPSGQPFDLASRYMAETVDVPIVDPQDGVTPTGMIWTIASQFSKKARAAALASTKLRLGAKGEVEAAEIDFDDTMLEQLVASVVRWEGMIVHGVPLDCTPENVRALLIDPRTAWIRPQIQTGYLSIGRFFAKASGN